MTPTPETPNPDRLRIVAMLFKWPHDAGSTIGGFDNAEDYLNAAADAWEADIRIKDGLAERNSRLVKAAQAIYAELGAVRKRLEAAEKENRALRANVSKSVLRRLEGQDALAGEE